MTTPSLTPELKHTLLQTQKAEITEALVYKNIAKFTKDQHNKEILLHIAQDEMRHYHLWKTYSKQDIAPHTLLVWLYTGIVRFFGITFGLKFMEQ